MKELIKIIHLKDNAVNLVILTPAITMENSAAIEVCLSAYLKAGFNVTLDMKDVNDITSSGIGALINAYQINSESEKSIDWQIVNVSDRITKILTIMNLENILPIIK